MGGPRAGGLAAFALLATISSASAQTLAAPAQRPGQGNFDRTHRGTQSLDASVSLASAYDDDVLADGGGSGSGSGPFGPQGGLYSAATTSLAYSKTFRVGEFGLSEGSAVRYYPSLTDLVAVQHSATAGLALHVGRTSFNVSQTLAYQPLFALVTGPRLFESGVGDLPLIPTDQTTVKRDQQSYLSTVGASQAIGQRTTLSFAGTFRKARFTGAMPDETTASIGGHLSRNVSRDLSLVGGYTYQQGTFQFTGVAQVARIHNIDVGVDYNHALGRTRRTTVGFTTGTTAVEQAGQATEFRLTGNARLNREIGRTWHATLAYTRGAGFVDGFTQPFFSDAIATSLGGALDRRFDVSFSGAYSKGQIGMTSDASQNDNYKGSARLRMALSRVVALSSEYFIYHYRFSEGAALPLGVPPALDRQGVRFGLDLWLPLIR